MFVTTIEQMNREPERTTSDLCSFLNLEFDPRMIDPDSYFNWRAREQWQSNSSLGQGNGFISIAGMSRWREHLPKDIWKTVELICGPEMRLLGYEPDFELDGMKIDAEVAGYLQREYGETRAWRGDFGRLEMDYGMELFRRALLGDPPEALDTDTIRRHFLFPSVFEALKGRTPHTLPAQWNGAASGMTPAKQPNQYAQRTEPLAFGQRRIGASEPVLIIAEIGVNHEGDAEVCTRMIGEAAKAGADAIKLQTMDADENYVPGTESHTLFSNCALSEEETAHMFDMARDLNLDAFTTCGDARTLEWVDRLNPAAHKISSGLLTHTPMIRTRSTHGADPVNVDGYGYRRGR